MNPEKDNKSLVPTEVQDATLPDASAEPERLLNEINLLKLEGRLFCFDPRQASKRTDGLTFEQFVEGLKQPLVIRPHPDFGQPSVIAYKLLQAIFLKLTEEGYPVPDTVSFSQRELARLVGRSSFGGNTSAQIFKAIMQLHSTRIQCALYDKPTKKYVMTTFYVLPRALISGRKMNIDRCTLQLDSTIVDSLNNRHFACFNWRRMQQLEPIGAALYKRLFFHFSNLMKPGLPAEALSPFEKDYADLCTDWLGGLKPERYKSLILSNQLGRHLEALKQSRLIRKYAIEKKVDGGWKLVFYPGNGFFNDYEEFYIKQWQPQLRFQQSADLRNIQQPLELVAYFHGLLGHDHNTFDDKETAYASHLLSDHLYEDLRDFVAFAVAAAKETNFKMQHFGAVRQYLPSWEAQREKRAEERRRRERVTACPHCDAAGYIRMLDAQGSTVMITCPHDLPLIEALEQRKGYRRVRPESS